MNFSFFTHPKSRCGSATIRGMQVAEYIGGKSNPVEGYENDICIYVKKLPPEDFPRHSYFDVIDNRHAIVWLQKHPQIGVIAISKTAKKYLQQRLNRTDIHLIPEHHCNYERECRTRNSVTTVGYMGSRTGSQFPVDIKERFAEMGLEFKYTNQYKTRQDVVGFYHSIDIQIMDRYVLRSVVKLKNPLKLENAGSFGIPTVAFPETNFIEEFGGCFVEARTIDEMILQCKKLKDDKEFYVEIANKALLRAEEYHISKIAPLYCRLK